MSSKYPLEAVHRLRQASTDAAAGTFADREARVRAAERARDLAQTELERARAARIAADAAERGRLEAGLERAGDLGRADQSRRAELERLARLEAERRALQGGVDAAEKARLLAARELEAALAAQKAVDEHRDQWSKQLARAAEQREEDAALERWNSERSGPSRR